VTEPFLRGALPIAKELERMGIFQPDHPNNVDKLYYLVRSGRIQLDRFGRELITTPSRLRAQVNKQVSTS
jgi:hypothetical protein